jgi:hypothetical protein
VRNVDTQTFEEHRVDPSVHCDARAPRAGGLEVRDPENLVGGVPFENEGIAGDAVQRDGDCKLI